jgi:hypothetical protein
MSAPLRCEACGHVAAPPTVHSTTVPAAGAINLCADPRACRERAQAAGTWKRYP